MDWTTLIVSLLTFIAGGGLVTPFCIRAARRRAQAEAAKAKAEADKEKADADNAAIAPLKQAIDILADQLKTANETIALKNEIIEQKTQHEFVLANKLTALYDDMCVHKGCKIRKPHQGQGQRWYEDHADDPSLGCDYLSIEWLLKQWRKRNTSDDSADDSADAEENES